MANPTDAQIEAYLRSVGLIANNVPDGTVVTVTATTSDGTDSTQVVAGP